MFLQGTLSIQISIIHWYYCLIHSIKKTLYMPIVNNLQISINTKCSPNNLSTSDRLPIFKLIQTKSSSIHQGWETAIFFLVRLNYWSDERDLCVTPLPSSLVSSNDPLSNVTYRGGDQTLLYFNPGHWQCSVTLADMLCTHRHWFLSTHNLLLLITG